TALGHPHYVNFVDEVCQGLIRWDKAGLNAALVFAELFKGLNNKFEKFTAPSAGAMRGKVAEIRDGLRAGREAHVKEMRGGKYEPYEVKDAALGLESVPRQNLVKTAEDKKSPAAEVYTADVDRVEVDTSGNEYWIEVKFDAHTATQKHSDAAQIDRLCATVRRA